MESPFHVVISYIQRNLRTEKQLKTRKKKHKTRVQTDFGPPEGRPPDPDKPSKMGIGHALSGQNPTGQDLFGGPTSEPYVRGLDLSLTKDETQSIPIGG
jgi:hypothetical protein